LTKARSSEVRHRIGLSCSLLAATCLLACKRKPAATADLHPANVAGRYVLLRPDGRPADTVEFRLDGTIHGRYADSTSRWAVQTSYGTSIFCSRTSGKQVCQPYRIVSDSLFLNTGPGAYVTLIRLDKR
jgi:hypothetical protein